MAVVTVISEVTMPFVTSQRLPELYVLLGQLTGSKHILDGQKERQTDRKTDIQV